MAGKRLAWGERGDAIFADGLARGLSGDEISAALRRAGVRGASPASVKRRLQERRGPVRTSSKPRAGSTGPRASTLATEAAVGASASLERALPSAPPDDARPAPSGEGSHGTAYTFAGDAGKVVGVARERLARALGQLPDAPPLAELRRLDHHDAILATASPRDLAHLVLFVSEDERTAREAGESDDEHEAFLEAHEAEHMARARKILRDALTAIPAVHASHFTTRESPGGS